MKRPKITRHLPESISTEILARLPLKSIARFKSVCKTWRSTLESTYFRRLFVSVHKNSSSSWSLLCGKEEFLNLHGCKTWGLPKSLASYNPNLDYKLSFSNGLVLIEGSDRTCFFVGNPVLQQWIQLPPLTHPNYRFGFVTKVDEDGVVLSFKVLRLASEERFDNETWFGVRIYSSETGLWSSKKLHFNYNYYVHTCSLIDLNGRLYLSASASFGNFRDVDVLIAYDFYDESELSRVIPLPDHDKRNFRRALMTTSCGFVMYIKTILDQEERRVRLKVWRLNNDDCWQFLWEICTQIDIRNYAIRGMHPFDSSIVYLCNQHKLHLVSYNLRKRNYKVLGEKSKRSDDNDHYQDCFVNQSFCETFKWGFSGRAVVVLYQLVLPRWMESMPRPSQAEIIDTTSLVSRITTLLKEKKDKMRIGWRGCR